MVSPSPGARSTITSSVGGVVGVSTGGEQPYSVGAENEAINRANRRIMKLQENGASTIVQARRAAQAMQALPASGDLGRGGIAGLARQAGEIRVVLVGRIGAGRVIGRFGRRGIRTLAVTWLPARRGVEGPATLAGQRPQVGIVIALPGAIVIEHAGGPVGGTGRLFVHGRGLMAAPGRSAG